MKRLADLADLVALVAWVVLPAGLFAFAEAVRP